MDLLPILTMDRMDRRREYQYHSQCRHYHDYRYDSLPHHPHDWQLLLVVVRYHDDDDHHYCNRLDRHYSFPTGNNNCNGVEEVQYVSIVVKRRYTMIWPILCVGFDIVSMLIG